jgi:hypothetical protein
LMEVCILKKHSFYFSPHSYLMICFHNIVAWK